LSLIAMLALLSHVFGVASATPRLDEAQSSVLKLSERMSAAAHDFLRTGARTPEAAPLPAQGQEGAHR